MTTVQKRNEKQDVHPNPDEDEQEQEQEEQEPPRPALTPKEEEALFNTYEKAFQKSTAAEAAHKAARLAMSNAVKAIKDAMGSGPFDWMGRMLTVSKAPKGEGFYFRGEKTREVKKIGGLL
jgi:flagellar biosynthesis GTPase FlhF